MNTHKQLIVFFILLVVNALLAAAAYTLLPASQLNPTSAPLLEQAARVPSWLLGLANGGIVLVLYGALGLGGYWLSRRAGLPGIYRPGAGWRAWVLWPMGLGLICGAVLVVLDRLFARLGNWSGFTHPEFPLSIIASATAGIGEEILFRLFFMGLWAFLLNLLLRRWKATPIAWRIANLLAALAFAAGHLPSAMVLFNVTSPAALPPIVLVEGLLLNTLIGLVAGECCVRDGMVAASGVHFWTDIVWHVIWPAL